MEEIEAMELLEGFSGGQSRISPCTKPSGSAGNEDSCPDFPVDPLFLLDFRAALRVSTPNTSKIETHRPPANPLGG